MTRVLVAIALSLSLITNALAQQDPVLAQIEVDRQSWIVYLNQQYDIRGTVWRWEYESQMRILEQNIEARRQWRLAELAEEQRKRDLERRQIEALERLANQPAVAPAPQPMNCTTTRIGNTAYTSCR